MSTDIAATLKHAHRIFTERPGAARKASACAIATWTGGLRCEVAGPADERAVTDMPVVIGGQGEGCNPGWLMRASLASCAATAIAMRAAMRGIALDTLRIVVESESDARGLVGIEGVSMAMDNLRMSVRIAARDVDPATLRELATTVAKTSPVNATLCTGPDVTLDVTVE
jgi:uncharacterized OsmC-like protein